MAELEAGIYVFWKESPLYEDYVWEGMVGAVAVTTDLSRYV